MVGEAGAHRAGSVSKTKNGTTLMLSSSVSSDTAHFVSFWSFVSSSNTQSGSLAILREVVVSRKIKARLDQDLCRVILLPFLPPSLPFLLLSLSSSLFHPPIHSAIQPSTHP